jgi:TolA-binding protein
MSSEKKGTARSLGEAELGRGFRSLMDDYLTSGERVDKERVFSQIVQRRTGLRAVESSPSRVPRWVRWAAPVAVAAAAAFAFAFYGLGSDPRDLTYVVTAHSGAQVDDQGSHRWSTEDEPLLVTFSDKSTVLLAPKTSVNLEVVESGKVRFGLERGRIHAHIAHHEDTDYRFRAGEYEVFVTGTEFDLSFEPSRGSGLLDMQEGSVEVSGPKGRLGRVLGGEKLALVGAPAKAEEPAVPPHEPVKAPAAEEPGERDDATASGAGDASSARVPSAHRSVTPSYRSLAKQARFAEIVKDAENRGLKAVLATKSPEELAELAHAARYVGRGDLATRVLKSLVQSHPTSSAAQSAHFFLGRIAEANGESQKAAREYDIYVKSRPGGSYVAEALGRRMALAQKSGDLSLATSLARQYLKRFPSGPYRAAALSLTEQAEGSRLLHR